MRTRSLILGALAAPAAALVHHQYASVPEGPPMRTKATATTTTIAPPPAPSYMKAFLRERLGYTDDQIAETAGLLETCLLYTSPSPRDISGSRMPSSA